MAIFFVLSGYLVTVSLERSPSLIEFFRRRALRIFPGLIAICLLCVFLLGPLLTTLPPDVYWRHDMTWNYLKTISAWVIKYPLPGVFADNPTPNAVNGSLWSLPYEISCYAVLALASVLPGALRMKVSFAFAGLLILFAVRAASQTPAPFDKFLGLDYYHTKLGLLFVLGAAFACWRDRFQPSLLLGLLMVVAAAFLPHGLALPLFLVGVGLVTLWMALRGRWLPRIPAKLGDWSYGAYLYGFPVQQVLAHFKLHEASFLGYVLVSTLVTFALAGLSWHLVEKQALRFK